jgi:hypothetical protein
MIGNGVAAKRHRIVLAGRLLLGGLSPRGLGHGSNRDRQGKSRRKHSQAQMHVNSLQVRREQRRSTRQGAALISDDSRTSIKAAEKSAASRQTTLKQPGSQKRLRQPRGSRRHQAKRAHS